jgi:predicted nucleic acid-binding protein
VSKQPAAPSAVYYFDSSALVKRYALETGTDWIKRLCEKEGNVQAIAHIGLVELAAALASKQRGGFLSLDEYDQLLAELVQDTQADYLLIAIDKVVIDYAIALTRRHKLRGYDAIHLTYALALQQILAAEGWPALTFVAADNDLLTAASAEGLSTDNLNDRP